MMFIIDRGSKAISINKKRTRKKPAFFMKNFERGSNITIISCYFIKFYFASSFYSSSYTYSSITLSPFSVLLLSFFSLVPSPPSASWCSKATIAFG